MNCILPVQVLYNQSICTSTLFFVLTPLATLWAVLLDVCSFAMMDYVDILSNWLIILLPFCVMVQNGNSFVLTWKQMSRLIGYISVQILLWYHHTELSFKRYSFWWGTWRKLLITQCDTDICWPATNTYNANTTTYMRYWKNFLVNDICSDDALDNICYVHQIWHQSADLLILSCWAKRYHLAHNVETAWHHIGARGVHM